MKKYYIYVVVFDVFFLVDYGVVIDCYYWLKVLKKIGVFVILYVFEYGCGEWKELLEVVDEVIYYKWVIGVK